MVDYGSGPALDENFDFAIDHTGDISTVEGVEELEKDVTFNIAQRVDEVGLGQRFEDSTEEDLRIELGLVVRDDPRINDITNLQLEQDENDQYQLNITLDTTAADGPFDLVIPIIN